MPALLVLLALPLLLTTAVALGGRPARLAQRAAVVLAGLLALVMIFALATSGPGA